jgi:D-arabinose 1-dehydrogenase-like Zn-dependent alcohol dehydrogenase
MLKIKDFVDYAFRMAEITLTRITQFADLYTGYYQHMIRDESSMAHISSSTSVLHIGCGAIPNTAVTLANSIGAKITALDNDINAVKKAKQYVKNSHLQQKIKVAIGDGTNYPIQNFEVIIISLGVEPIRKVLQNIASSANSNTKIIYRRTRYGKKQQIPQDTFLVQKKVKHHMFRIFSFTEALLLIKKGSSEKDI